MKKSEVSKWVVPFENLELNVYIGKVYGGRWGGKNHLGLSFEDSFIPLQKITFISRAMKSEEVLN
jgi:hypothetical protein